MSTVIDFMEAVKKDPALQAKLQALVKKHQDEKLDEAKFEKFFNEEAAPVAKEAGFVINFADYKALVQKDRKLSDEELALVAGGKDFFEGLMRGLCGTGFGLGVVGPFI